MVLVQSIMDQTNSRLAPQLGHGLRTKTPEIQPAPDGLPILLRNGHGLSVKSKWIKLAPGRLLDRFLGSNVPSKSLDSYLFLPKNSYIKVLHKSSY